MESQKVNYDLRRANEGDYEFCYKLTKQNMYDLFCRHWGGWFDSEFRKGFVADNIQIIRVRDKAIGYFSYVINKDSLYIDNIQLASQFQGQGIGTKLLTDFLTKNQNTVIRLTTFEDNPAKHLYEKLGFKVIVRNGSTIKMEIVPNKSLQPTTTASAE
ncbi:GNAT family N-acetyltransferase [Methylophaga frappieri]|uniref:GNAT family N-acetyltransferase n=1 Tax=Methylophaga frappieri (strain ATCC BAA-2434 / DSM 25690 / JAM7) TaxID=754477 RepID=UPI00059CFD42|nr:GNAT family N-acetyltransferase [Methylophaga frappieri]